MTRRRNRFVSPDTIKIDISGDDWIEIKKQLTVGEARKMQLGGITMKGQPGKSEMELNLDIEALSMAKVLVYLVDWSFVDVKDKRVPLTRQAIEALDEESYKEIEKAIDKHVATMEEEKKALPIGTGPRLKTISQ